MLRAGRAKRRRWPKRGAFVMSPNADGANGRRRSDVPTFRPGVASRAATWQVALLARRRPAQIVLAAPRRHPCTPRACRPSNALRSSPSTSSTAPASSTSAAGRCPCSTRASSTSTAPCASAPASSTCRTWARSRSPARRPCASSIISSPTTSPRSSPAACSTRRCVSPTDAWSTTSSSTAAGRRTFSSASTLPIPTRTSPGSTRRPSASTARCATCPTTSRCSPSRARPPSRSCNR